MRDTAQIVTPRHDLDTQAYLDDLLKQVEYSERRNVGYRPPDFLIPGFKEREAAMKAADRRQIASALALGASASILLGIAIAMIVILVDPPPMPVIGEGMASAVLVACSLWIIGVMAWLVWGNK